MASTDTTPTKYAPWQAFGRRIGYIRNGTYYIHRTLPGAPAVRLSTGCVDEEAAFREYQKFEKDPEGFVLRRAQPLAWDELVRRYLRYSELTLQNTRRHVEKQTGYFANLALFGAFQNVNEFAASEVREYMAWRADGGVEGRLVERAAVNRDLAALFVSLELCESEVRGG